MVTATLAPLEEIASRIVGSYAVSIRDVDSGKEPFVYSTGNRGPGYVMIKGLVGQRKVLKFLTGQLAIKVAPLFGEHFDFIEGNATGGMVPAWQLTDDVERVLGLEEGTIPYNYLRGSRKEGGHGELITGNGNNPLVRPGMKALVVEELVNYAGTTTNAAEEFRSAGYLVTHAACILSYDHPQSNDRLRERGVTLLSLMTLPTLLDVSEAQGLLPKGGIDSYRAFLADPVGWQLGRNLVIPTDSAKKAMEKGWVMRELTSEEALARGAPAGKLKEGVVYWAPDGK